MPGTKNLSQFNARADLIYSFTQYFDFHLKSLIWLVSLRKGKEHEHSQQLKS